MIEIGPQQKRGGLRGLWVLSDSYIGEQHFDIHNTPIKIAEDTLVEIKLSQKLVDLINDDSHAGFVCLITRTGQINRWPHAHSLTNRQALQMRKAVWPDYVLATML